MKKTLLKVLEELKKDKPRIDYVLGMLEVLVEEDEPKIFKTENSLPTKTTLNTTPSIPATTQSIDEGAMLDSFAKANLETVKNLAQKSSE